MEFRTIGSVSKITQRCNKKLSQIQNHDPMMIYVLRGQKQVECSGEFIQVEAGQLLVVPVDAVMNVVNLYEDNDGYGDYQAICFSWQTELLQQVNLLNNKQKQPRLQTIKAIAKLPDNFVDALKSITKEILNDNQTNNQKDSQNNNQVDIGLIKHLFVELLLRLAALDIYFDIPKHKTLTKKIRHIISQNPGKKWQSAEIAKQFAMSESTLRRRLLAEENSLSQIILEVRLNQGLMLLQTTNKPILQIAQDIGYDSGSRFAMYFKKRFGFSPKALRG